MSRAHARRGSMLVAACLATALSVHAQFNMFFTSDRDLPNSLINEIAQDSDGMIWVATEDGLCRYNGSQFTTYKNQVGNPNSLCNNFIRSVCTDTLGHVLVGTSAGLQVYRPRTNDFTPALTSKKQGVSASNVNHICLLKNGDFFVSGIDCFTIHFDKHGKTANIEDNITIKANPLTGKVNDVFRSLQTSDGNIWIARQAHGVDFLDTKGKLYSLQAITGNKYNMSVLCEGNNKRLYAGGSDFGVYMFNKATKCFDLIPGTEYLTQVYDIKPIPGTNTLCIATDGVGIRFFDTQTQRTYISQQFDDPIVDMSAQKTHSLLINRFGDIWVGLYQRGLFMAAHTAAAFTYIGPRSKRYNLIDDHCVTSLLQMHDGTLWAATDNGGLYGFTPDLMSLYRHSVDFTGNGIPPAMHGLFEDSRHRVWFGSYGHGGGMVDVKTGKCTYVPLAGTKGNKFSIYGYIEDKHGTVWAASMGNGVLRYDEEDKCFKPYINTNGAEWSGAIYYDRKDDIIYLGTYSGVTSFSPADKAKKTKNTATETIVYSISRANDELLAAATNKGLLLLNKKTGKTQMVTTEQGLPSDNVYASQPAADNHIWISTTSGLTCLDLKNMTTETYTMRDGLQGNEFYKNASMITSDGRLWFGGINGITAFHPKAVNRHLRDCMVRVVGLRVNDSYILADEDGKYFIPYGNNALTIELATIPLFMSHRVTYMYRLDSGKWEKLPVAQNILSINNLSYGWHKLYTKTIIDGKETAESQTEIYIERPWFLRWWAMLIWLTLLGVIGYNLYINVQRRRHMRKRLLEHQREEEVKESKLQFFMNIVHDLRTPLTLIMTPLQKLQTSDTDSHRQRLYDIMGRNAERLLRLTNEIMDLRKIDRGKMELHCQETHISQFIREIVNSMSDIAQTHRQQLIMNDTTTAGATMWIDSQNVEKILMNLISNALKYTQEGGTIEVAWGLAGKKELPKGSTDMLQISVTDNGIGISEDDKKHIFDRFYQVRVNDKHIKGTGIGLNLVQALVELHHGEISVSDNPEGKGSRFTVLLPVSKEAYTAEELSNIVSTDDANAFINTSAVSMEAQGAEAVENAENIDENGKNSTSEAIPATTNDNTPTHKMSSTKTLLIVDDDDDIRQFLAEEFAAMYNIIESSNGKLAYEILQKENVDIVISDIMMPEVDGIELCKMIRQNVRISHMPIVLLTAKSSDQDRIEGMQASADAYVTKPFNFALLQTIIGNLLIRHDKLRNTFKGYELPTDQIETPEIQSADDKLMERILKVINENLSNPDLTSEFLAKEVGLSRVHLYRKLKELTNQSATNYIRNIRLTVAAEMLRKNKATIAEVAYNVGFRTPAHFSTAFKELYGVTPKEYVNNR